MFFLVANLFRSHKEIFWKVIYINSYHTTEVIPSNPPQRVITMGIINSKNILDIHYFKNTSHTG